MTFTRRIRPCMLFCICAVSASLALLYFTGVKCTLLCTKESALGMPQLRQATNKDLSIIADNHTGDLRKSAEINHQDSHSSGLSPNSCQDSVSPARDILWQEKWPEREQSNSRPYEELVKTFAGLELRPISQADCRPSGTPNITLMALLTTIFKDSGGVYMGEGMILAQPLTFTDDAKAWIAADPGSADPTKVIVAVKSVVELQPLLASVVGQLSASTPLPSSPTVTSMKCATVEGFTLAARCVATGSKIYPQDFMTNTSAFAELARWLFYGKRRPVQTCRDPSNPIPRLAHYIKLKPPGSGNHGYRNPELTFSHFLSIISALYVGGFERVYLHTDQPPTGRWWDELSKENVTVVPVYPPRSVFQQEIKVIQHVGDVLRIQILNQYGGTYTDFDAVWVSRVPDWLLEFPAVLGMEWVKAPSDFPEVFNNGVFMARAGSSYLRHYIKTYADFRDRVWEYNSLWMSFHTYELYPETLYLDRHLQVICYEGRCHPPWEQGYVRPMDQPGNVLRITDWKADVRAFHITGPKPHRSLASPEAIATRKGLFSTVGRYILEKSGRLQLLKTS